MLTTERLQLRPWRAADAKRLRAITNKEAVVRHVGGGRFWTHERVQEFIERQTRHHEQLGYCLWAVSERDDERAIGYVGIQPLGETGETEIGWLLDEPYHGRGLATEAATCAMRHGFENVGLDRIVAIAVPDNAASINVMQKLGMSYETDIEWKGFTVSLYARFNPARFARRD